MEWPIIPWESQSAIVPASAIRTLHAFNQNYNYMLLVQCRDCEYAEPEPPSNKRSRKAYQGGYWCEYWSEGIGAWCPADGFCHAGKPREKACRNADEKEYGEVSKPFRMNADEARKFGLIS